MEDNLENDGGTNKWRILFSDWDTYLCDILLMSTNKFYLFNFFSIFQFSNKIQKDAFITSKDTDLTLVEAFDTTKNKFFLKKKGKIKKLW